MIPRIQFYLAIHPLAFSTSSFKPYIVMETRNLILQLPVLNLRINYLLPQ